MIFEYEELQEAVQEDFERFLQMGFDASQILPAVLCEYEHGEDFCREENLLIHIFLAQNYERQGLETRSIVEKLRQMLAEETEALQPLDEKAAKSLAELLAGYRHRS